MALLTLRSLQRREYRLFFFGQLVSLHGTWMQNVAQAWLVYRLTDSSFLLGLVAFASLIPVLLFGLPGGWLADRLPRRRLFLATQLLALLQALVLAGLTFSGHIAVWHILVLAFLLGCVHAVEIPARHSLLPSLVPREELHNAVALNASVFNLARFLGPALAGLLIVRFGEAWVFLLNAMTFSATLLALLAMGLEARERGSGARPRLGMLDGFHYAWRDLRLRHVILLVAAVSLCASPYTVLMPVFAREVFQGGPDVLGYLLGAAGGGALLAALRLAGQRDGEGIARWITLATLLAGMVLMLFSRLDSFALALPVLALAGFAVTTVIASTNTYLQLAAPDALRGRIMSLFSTLFIGVAPLGNLLAGSLAEVLGVRTAMLLLGGGCLLAGLWYRWRGRVLVSG
ncbi:MAG: MFS transporter [Xanthomonadaceae bacterium]|nr:MFS transporter [Xanthomonadaceae bacterium]